MKKNHHTLFEQAVETVIREIPWTNMLQKAINSYHDALLLSEEDKTNFKKLLRGQVNDWDWDQTKRKDFEQNHQYERNRDCVADIINFMQSDISITVQRISETLELSQALIMKKDAGPEKKGMGL